MQVPGKCNRHTSILILVGQGRDEGLNQDQRGGAGLLLLLMAKTKSSGETVRGLVVVRLRVRLGSSKWG